MLVLENIEKSSRVRGVGEDRKKCYFQETLKVSGENWQGQAIRLAMRKDAPWFKVIVKTINNLKHSHLGMDYESRDVDGKLN